MILHFFEVTNAGLNWGKFGVGRFTAEEWAHPSAVEAALGLSRSLLAGRGWSQRHLLVMDLQTGEAALFLPGGFAEADLRKRRVWTCPLFGPFLAWLYEQDVGDLGALPHQIVLPEAESAWFGYRQPGPSEALYDDLLAAARAIVAAAPGPTEHTLSALAAAVSALTPPATSGE